MDIEEKKARRSETQKRYGIKHSEEKEKRNKIYYQQNAEKIKERSNLYNRENIILLTEKTKLYHSVNKEKYVLLKQRRKSKKLSLPHTLTDAQWEISKAYFNNTCCYCGKKLPLAQDHFVALSKGGEFTSNNIVPSCKSCNCKKHTSDFFTWYPKYKYYSKKRECFILKFLNYKDGIQQLKII